MLIVAAALVIGLVLRRAGIGAPTIALVFLTAVLLDAVRYGLWPALFASLLSVLAYNFFFFPPLYTLSIADPENAVTLLIFALVAVIASNLAARVRTQAMAAQQQARTTESLYRFSRKLAEVFTLDDLLWAISYQIAQMLKVRVVLLLPGAGDLAVRAGYPPEDSLPRQELEAAGRSFAHDAAAGSGAENDTAANRLYVPMRTGRGSIGVIVIDSDRPIPAESDDWALVRALSDQAALAIERMNLAEEFERSRVAAETERLRSALLRSLSHDLRTPLASILGSATSLKVQHGALDEDSQRELIATIEEEAERLHRFIANLLDMTRIESGAIVPCIESIDIADVIGSALHRAREILRLHQATVDLPPDLPMVRLDPVLFEQVLFNLLDNAGKYSPAHSTIAVSALLDEITMRLRIADEGPGIPPEDFERVFDPFYRVKSSDGRRAGTGLGLAICRGFMQAMGGSIIVENGARSRGAVLIVSIPVSRQEAAP